MTGSLSGEINDVFLPTLKIHAGPTPNTLQPIDFILDTGFNDCVTVGERTYRQLGRQPFSVMHINTAAGLVARRTCIIYIRWDDSTVVDVQEAILVGFDAVGTLLLEGAKLHIDFVQGSKFSVTRPA